ncbi:MAG: hypothetical protein E2P02_02110 [Acidobacteria bacterium]|nr:MAG: hypothetical protein E2P02_02110 [Acidobacteriota bacterium]
MSTTSTAAAVLDAHMEVRITGSVEAVWKALTDDIGAWWPETFFAGVSRRNGAITWSPNPVDGCTKPGRVAAAFFGQPSSRWILPSCSKSSLATEGPEQLSKEMAGYSLNVLRSALRSSGLSTVLSLFPFESKSLVGNLRLPSTKCVAT